MTDSEPSEINVFGSTYEVDESGSIDISQKLSASQARDLDYHFGECISLQEAVRKSSDKGIDERRQTLTVDQFKQQAETVSEVAEYSHEMLAKLDAIHAALDD